MAQNGNPAGLSWSSPSMPGVAPASVPSSQRCTKVSAAYRLPACGCPAASRRSRSSPASASASAKRPWSPAHMIRHMAATRRCSGWRTVAARPGEAVGQVPGRVVGAHHEQRVDADPAALEHQVLVAGLLADADHLGADVEVLVQVVGAVQGQHPGAAAPTPAPPARRAGGRWPRPRRPAPCARRGGRRRGGRAPGGPAPAPGPGCRHREAAPAPPPAACGPGGWTGRGRQAARRSRGRPGSTGRCGRGREPAPPPPGGGRSRAMNSPARSWASARSSLSSQASSRAAVPPSPAPP